MPDLTPRGEQLLQHLTSAVERPDRGALLGAALPLLANLVDDLLANEYGGPADVAELLRDMEQGRAQVRLTFDMLPGCRMIAYIAQVGTKPRQIVLADVTLPGSPADQFSPRLGEAVN